MAECSYAIATALVPFLGYEKVETIIKSAKENNLCIKDAVLKSGLINAEQYGELISAKNLIKLGFCKDDIERFEEK